MQRPSIVIICIDALRADCAPRAEASAHLHSLGLTRPHLPAFTELVRGATAFTQAIACSSYTTTCHASLFTGLLPPEHGVRAFSVTALNRAVRTLAEILTANGYAACAMSDTPQFFQPFGLLRGFATVVSTEDEALAWWDSYDGQPRLLFMHLWDVHHPYGMPAGRAYRSDYPKLIAAWQQRLRSRRIAIPPPDESRFENPERYHVGLMQVAWQQDAGFASAMRDYIGGVETFDSGRLAGLAAAFQARRIPASTITVVTADHGEGRDWPPSQLAKHGTTLKDDQIRIPLFIQMPDSPPVERTAAQVSQADIAPTILDALGLLSERTAPRTPLSGRSLLPALHGQTMPNQAAYAEMSTVFRDPLLPIDDPAARRHPMIRYRAVRYPQRKYWLVGKPITWSDKLLMQPAEELVGMLFHDVLGRRSGEDEEQHWLTRARSATDIAKRRALVQRFEQSGEFTQLPKETIYDLGNDPLEVKPVNARRNEADRGAFSEQLAVINEIDAAARAGEPLISSQADEQVILARLQGLGYVE